MPQTKLLHTIPATIALALACAMAAHAQSSSPTGPGPSNSSTQQAGEAYPSDPNAANKNKPKMKVIQKAEDSTPVQATKRVAKRTKNAVKRAGNRSAQAVRNTGDKINQKVPPGPNDAKK